MFLLENTTTLVIVLHIFLVDVGQPEAAFAFNNRLIETLTYSLFFFDNTKNSAHADISIHRYNYVSPVLNLGYLVVYMPLLLMVSSLVSCGGKNKTCNFLRRHLSYKACLNFYVAYQIIFLISGFIYLWKSETYWGGYVSATRLLS